MSYIYGEGESDAYGLYDTYGGDEYDYGTPPDEMAYAVTGDEPIWCKRCGEEGHESEDCLWSPEDEPGFDAD